MSEIFISYAKEDRSRVVTLALALEAHGWSVFWDRVIPAGRDWRDVIAAELDQARCIIVIWSKTSIRSRWVREEADVGQERGILVPTLIDQVPPVLGFRTLQAADLIDWDGQASAPAFRRLTKDIASLIGSPQREDRPREQPTEQRTAVPPAPVEQPAARVPPPPPEWPRQPSGPPSSLTPKWYRGRPALGCAVMVFDFLLIAVVVNAFDLNVSHPPWENSFAVFSLGVLPGVGLFLIIAGLVARRKRQPRPQAPMP
jgi:hypothetical protein